MEVTQELFEKIEAYIAGSLSAEEQKLFETTIENTPGLKKEIDLHREIQHELSAKNTLDFRKKLAQINKEVTEENLNKTKNTSLTYWKIAASILILIGLSSLLWFPFSSSNQDLFAAYYTPYPIEHVKRGGENTTANDFKETLFLYKNKEYKKAIPGLEKVIATDPGNETLQLCLGNAYLNTNQLEKAEDIFNTFSPNHDLYDDAQWFLAFAYLKKNQKPEMITILKELVSKNTKYKKEAVQLLQELEK